MAWRDLAMPIAILWLLSIMLFAMVFRRATGN